MSSEFEQENPYQAPLVTAEDESRRRRRDRVRGGYAKVRRGMQLMYYGNIAYFIIGIIAFVTAMTSAGSSVGVANEPGLAPEMLLTLSGLYLICAGVIFVGCLYCLKAPRSPERTRILVSIVCQTLSFLASFAVGFLAADPNIGFDEAQMYQYIQIASQIVAVVGTFYIILFVCVVGECTGNYTIIRAAQSAKKWFIILMIAGGVLLGVIWTTANGTYHTQQEANAALGIVGIVTLPVLIVAFVTFIRILIMHRTGAEELRH